MPTTLQHVALGEELLTAVRLLTTGLRELNRLQGQTDFYHLPILLLSSGFERMFKTVICCHTLATTGDYPNRNVFPRGRKGHDLMWLLDKITRECFTDDYLAGVPAARTDVEYLRDDEKLRRMLRILSDFGQGTRYYNLNVVLGEQDPGPEPEREWSSLKSEILQGDASWASRLQTPTQIQQVHSDLNREFTIRLEQLARSVSRLFTLGGLGEQARSISPHLNHFLFLKDNQLGTVDYEAVLP